MDISTKTFQGDEKTMASGLPGSTAANESKIGTARTIETNTLWNKIETLSKIAAVFAGCVYATGFFIVSIYLAGFGIVESSIVRPRIFLSGGTFCTLVLVS